MDLQHLAEEDLDGVLRRFSSGLDPANLGAVRTDAASSSPSARSASSCPQTRSELGTCYGRGGRGDADAPDALGDNESGQTGHPCAASLPVSWPTSLAGLGQCSHGSGTTHEGNRSVTRFSGHLF